MLPTAAQIAAARFEQEYDKLVADFNWFVPGRIPPSRELVLDEARRGASDVFEVLHRMRVRLSAT